MTLATYSSGLSDDEIRRLARWPDAYTIDPDSGVRLARQVGAQDYMRVLLEALLRYQPQLRIESRIIVYKEGEGYYECWARLQGPSRDVSVIAGGGTPEVARINAELFAVRKALFNQDVPVLGLLLSRRRLTIELSFYKDEPVLGLQGDWYMLTLREDHGDTLAGSWLGPPVLPRREYCMRVSLQQDDVDKRTRYLIVNELPPDVEKLARPFMNTQTTIYLHRLLLALQGKYLNEMTGLNEVRRLLECSEYESDLRHGHHINGIGYDNREENLQALTEQAHAIHHSVWMRNPNNVLQGFIRQRDKGVHAMVTMPKQLVVVPSHYDMLDMARYFGQDVPLVTPNIEFEEGAPLSFSLAGLACIEPVTVPEIEAQTRKKPRRDNMCLVVSALIKLGGHGRYADLKNARSLRGVSEGAVRNALSALEGMGIIISKPLGRFEGRKKGVERMYSLVRPPAPDLWRLMRPRGHTPGRRSPSRELP